MKTFTRTLCLLALFAAALPFAGRAHIGESEADLIKRLGEPVETAEKSDVTVDMALRGLGMRSSRSLTEENGRKVRRTILTVASPEYEKLEVKVLLWLGMGGNFVPDM